jgi:predicted membrane channel-forming protein YqfA (hemolysin III family)
MAQDKGGIEFDLKKILRNQDVLPDFCQQTEEDDDDAGDVYFDQYEIKDTSRICWRVLCVNEVTGKKINASLLGPTGHLERMNAWTHIAAAFIYLLYACIRPSIYGSYRSSTTNDLATAAAAALVATYFISSSYHVASANKFWSAVWRIGDYGGIYAGIAAGYLVDLSAATRNLNGVPWQSIADMWIASAAMVIFFVVRRVTTPIDETRMPYFSQLCSVGLARYTNVDLEHSSLRAAAGSTLVFSWILIIPGSFVTLEPTCAGVFLGSHIMSTLVLIMGMFLDNVLFYPDKWVTERNGAPSACACYSSQKGVLGGWMMTSHAWWHVIAFLATMCNSIGVEFVVATSDVLSNATTQSY